MLCICRKHVRALAVLLLALGGCAGPLQYKQLTNTAHGLPPAHELSGTAFYPQQIHHCGPAALATVLAAAGVSTTPEELSQLVYLPQREGSLSIELTAAVRHFGYLSYELQPRLQDLLTEIASGHPVLVLQNLGLSWLPRWHYAVAIGYNLQEETIILRSGAHRRVLTDIATFER
ncbi:MAG TPA: PA2778 family cysteine peptidase, partial [Gammaproteobacteria bacterium]